MEHTDACYAPKMSTSPFSSRDQWSMVGEGDGSPGALQAKGGDRATGKQGWEVALVAATDQQGGCALAGVAKMVNVDAVWGLCRQRVAATIEEEDGNAKQRKKGRH
ncbi:hypothetical protein OPV22_010523 [Ensete ventricosum]|uniref:Uncharacterized protein n=1 Tax=Ensete ventricosum TaxID=4639 RepID=A0AAV8RHL1_ENSVE|nr:hypothetical protein OPV22_010523 [Ensete ventricosum]